MRKVPGLLRIVAILWWGITVADAITVSCQFISCALVFFIGVLTFVLARLIQARLAEQEHYRRLQYAFKKAEDRETLRRAVDASRWKIARYSN